MLIQYTSLGRDLNHTQVPDKDNGLIILLHTLYSKTPNLDFSIQISSINLLPTLPSQLHPIQSQCNIHLDRHLWYRYWRPFRFPLHIVHHPYIHMTYYPCWYTACSCRHGPHSWTRTCTDHTCKLLRSSASHTRPFCSSTPHGSPGYSCSYTCCSMTPQNCRGGNRRVRWLCCHCRAGLLLRGNRSDGGQERRRDRRTVSSYDMHASLPP